MNCPHCGKDVPLRPRKIDREVAAGMRRSGWKLRQIAEFFGVSPQGVWKALREGEAA